MEEEEFINLTDSLPPQGNGLFRIRRSKGAPLVCGITIPGKKNIHVFLPEGGVEFLVDAATATAAIATGAFETVEQPGIRLKGEVQ
jgi:hypothetical protein